jgi:DNA-binding MarR family transcriptional regulator
VPTSLSLDLHVLTAQLDRAADRVLRARFGVPYRRYLALTMVGDLGAGTQRVLAERLGVTEPSVSRMTGVLARDGLLDVAADAGAGHRRRLSLTPAGRDLVDQCRAVLEQAFADLVERSGIRAAEYAEQTGRLLAEVDGGLR